MHDSDLLTRYTQGSEAAFAELVRRHVDLVFGTALRQVGGDRHRAEDIVQQVFTDLAHKARTLTRHPTLAGWLYASTRYTALNTVRREQRRTTREKQFAAMNTPTPGTEARWEQIRPAIDEAMQELDEDDRQSLLLRFFGQQPFAAMAAQLGISENAAQKRVDRALDRLNVVLRQRGITSTAVALGVALGESCIAAPATLAASVTAAALANTVAAGTGAAWLGFAKIAAAVAAAGLLGWAGVRWSEPRVPAGGKPIPAVAVVHPAQTKAAPTSPPAAQLPPPTTPTSSPPPVLTLPPPAVEQKVYVVGPGDTLSRIARMAGVTPQEIAAENPGFNVTRMRVGAQLLLPAQATLPTTASQPARPAVPIPADQNYVVQPGDTLQKIAQIRDLLPEELQALNPGINWQQLQVGQSIRAP
ncbi:MAG TPA: sigma-70 family RNA polymerase sigma factor [Lacunisphaera sp.]|nr:sigma-70 family RNA polymerase sigma factor [Lacunisphaera sp.]